MTEALEVLLDILFVILLLIPVALIIWGMISTIRADKKRIRRHGYRNSDAVNGSICSDMPCKPSSHRTAGRQMDPHDAAGMAEASSL